MHLKTIFGLYPYFPSIFLSPVRLHPTPGGCKLHSVVDLEAAGTLVHPGDDRGVVGHVVKQVPEQEKGLIFEHMRNMKYVQYGGKLF